MSAGQLPTATERTARIVDRTASTRRFAERRLDAPAVLGRYRLIRRLGAGAYGTVWSAHDERLERQVAVKIVPRERIVGGRFEREARAAARLAHPGIVTLYEAGADDEGAYLVSELVRGDTLAELLEAGRLSDRDLVLIGVALCEALAHAHSQGVVHRDVKPSNILVPEQPSTATQIAKLTDFGVARVVGGDSLTRTGDVIGTAAYMAPEQAAGRDAGPTADLYALALVLYEGLTGINPVRTGTAAQRARKLGAHLPPLRRQRRELPRELGQGIDLALRPRPRERGSIEDLSAALLASLTAVGDEPGVVTGAWRRETGARRDAGTEPPNAVASAPEGAAGGRFALGQRLRAAPVPLADRVLAGFATAGLVGWLGTHVAHPSPVPLALLAPLAGALVALLPRLGWVALGVSASASMAASGRPGAALVVGLAALIPLLLLPLAGGSLPLAAGAPALGAIGLAGAWPAVAARARGVWRRAALGAIGWIWLVLTEWLTGSHLYLGRPKHAVSPDAWERSLHVALHDMLQPIVSSGALAPAIVWATAAIALPWLVRGRSAVLDVVRVVVWSAVLVSATSTAVGVASGSGGHPTPRGAVVGALAAVALALAPTAVWLRRSEPRPPAARVRLP